MIGEKISNAAISDTKIQLAGFGWLASPIIGKDNRQVPCRP
jgi:hypothetical protein